MPILAWSRRISRGSALALIAMRIYGEAKPPLGVEHVPVSVTYRGGQFYFAANVPNYGLVRSATAFYLFSNTANPAAGERVFHSLPLKNDGARFTGALPVPAKESRHLILYFLRFDTAAGVQYVPDRTAGVEVYHKARLLDDSKPPSVLLLTPGDGAELPATALQLQYAIQDEGTGPDWASLRVWINGVDYAKSAQIKGNIISVALPRDLPVGSYKHTVSVRDLAGNQSSDLAYTFQRAAVQENPGVEVTTKPWKGSGSVSFGYNASIGNIQNKEEISWQALQKTSVRNMTIQYTATNDDATIELGPAIISSQPATPGVRPNRFSFGFKKSNLDLKWGDISSQISPLTLNTSMLGAHLGYKTDKEARAGSAEFKAAYGQTKQAYEPQPNSLSGAYARNSVGVYSGYNISKNLLVYGAYQHTADLPGSLQDKRNLDTFNNQGGEAGGAWEIPDWKLKLTGRYALSVNEGHASLTGERNFRSQGYSTASSVNWVLKPLDLNLGFNFEQTSQNFSLLSGGGASPDRRLFSGTLGRSFFKGTLNVNSNNSTSRNNLKNERPETQYTYNTANTFGINIPNWPGINYSSNIIVSQSTGVGDVRTRTLNNSNTLGASYAYALLFKQTINANGSYATVRDQSSPAKGNDTNSIGLNGGWQGQVFGWLGVNFNAGRNENVNLATGDANLSNTLSTTLNFTFFSGKFTESLSMNQNQTFLRKGGETTLQSTAYNYSLNTQVNPTDAAKFSLSLNYSTAINASDRISAYPGNLAVTFQFNMVIKDFEAEQQTPADQGQKTERR